MKASLPLRKVLRFLQLAVPVMILLVAWMKRVKVSDSLTDSSMRQSLYMLIINYKICWMDYTDNLDITALIMFFNQGTSFTGLVIMPMVQRPRQHQERLSGWRALFLALTFATMVCSLIFVRYNEVLWKCMHWSSSCWNFGGNKSLGLCYLIYQVFLWLFIPIKPLHNTLLFLVTINS